MQLFYYNSIIETCIKVDITSPPAVIDHFLKANYPPIYKHVEVDENMVNPFIRKKLIERGVKFPLAKQLTLCFNATDYLLTTDLAKFYVEKGMVLSNLSLVVEYPRTTPLANFVKEITDKRKEATRLQDNNLQNTYKLTANSSYGRLGLNLENRKKYTYKKIGKGTPDVQTKKQKVVRPVFGEFEPEYVETETNQENYTDSVPGN